MERKRVTLEKAVDLWIRETMAAVALREVPITHRIVLDAAGPSSAVARALRFSPTGRRPRITGSLWQRSLREGACVHSESPPAQIVG